MSLTIRPNSRTPTTTDTRPAAGRTARAIAAAAPAHRDRFVDFLRAGSLVVVVLGHWLMATVVVTHTGGPAGVHGVNALSSIPFLQLVTWALQVMPLFFVAGGFANATVWRHTRERGGRYADYLHGRLARLVPQALAFVVVVQAGLALADAAGLVPDLVRLAGRLLGQPLWFLGVYVVITALAPAAHRAHRHRPVTSLLVLVAAAVVVEVARWSGATQVGYLNLAFVWLFAQQLGFWYADGRLARASRAVLWSVLAAAVAALVALTGPGPYPVSMVGLPGEISNMSPPTVCLLVLTVGQLAAAMLVRSRITAWLARPAPWAAVASLGAVAMTIYVWHLVAAVVVFGVALGFGLALPEATTGWWWITRPAWLAALTVALAGVVVLVTRAERAVRGRRRRRPRDSVRAPGPSTLREVVAAVLAVALVAFGLLGQVASGLAPAGVWTSTLLVVPVDPVQNTACLAAGLGLSGWAARRARVGETVYLDVKRLAARAAHRTRD